MDKKVKLTNKQKELFDLYISENYLPVEDAYVEDCFFEDGKAADGRHEFILIRKYHESIPAAR